MHRLFVAIQPPEGIRDLLVDAMDDSPELSWVADCNLHLTLRFIGEVERPRANDLAAALAQIHADSFALRISGTGMFDRRGGGAVWAAVEPRAAVVALAAKVERACQSVGLEPERRGFHPHLTLARFGRHQRAIARAFLDRNRALATPAFDVRDFILFESRLSRHGAHYEEVARYRLSGERGPLL